LLEVPVTVHYFHCWFAFVVLTMALILYYQAHIAEEAEFRLTIWSLIYESASRSHLCSTTMRKMSLSVMMPVT